MYQIAECKVDDPVFVSDEPDQFFCRCLGGPAWLGYRRFDPHLAGLMSDRSEDKVSTPKYLKENERIARETYRSVGDIQPIGKYVVMRRYDDMPEGQAAKCIVCFGTSEQIRDLCALGHFGSRDVFNAISIPWGPACATLITFPAGMGRKCSATPNMRWPNRSLCQRMAARKLHGYGNSFRSSQEDGQRCSQIIPGKMME
jgi:hypothetical protein